MVARPVRLILIWSFKQKRELSGFAEQITSYLNLAQSEAIKRNETVSFSWDSPGGHNKNWCMGASMFPQNTPCDCEETDDTQADYCSIDGVSYRWVQSDFANADYDFIHMNPNDSSFAFDPIRGIVVDIEDTESTDGDYLFYVHSDMKNEQNNKRLYELQIRMSLTGRATICTDDDRDRVVGGYAIC